MEKSIIELRNLLNREIAKKEKQERFEYLIDAIEKKWVYSWRDKGWKKADKSPALNPDLWEKLLKLIEKHDIKFVWVKGHAGHSYNERCDKLATDFADSFED